MAGPKKNDELRAASIERILACAIELFVRHGYQGTTVEAIAARAGLTKGAIYFYFKTKDAVLMRLLDEVEAAVVDPVVALMAKVGPPADQKLVSFIHHQSFLGITHPLHILLLILASIEFLGSGTDMEVRVAAIYRRLYTCVEGFVRQGQAEGVFRTDVSSKDLTAIVISSHDGVLVEWYRRSNELEGKTLTGALSSILVGGLMAPQPSPALRRPGRPSEPRQKAVVPFPEESARQGAGFETRSGPPEVAKTTKTTQAFGPDYE